MSSEPSNIATIPAPNTSFFPHNIYTKEYHPSNLKPTSSSSTASGNVDDPRSLTTTRHPSSIGNNNASTTANNNNYHNLHATSDSMNDREILLLQLQRQALNGALSMSSPPPHSSMLGSGGDNTSEQRFADRKSPTRDLDISGSLNLLAAAFEPDTDASKLKKTSPETSVEVDMQLEQKRLEHERQRMVHRRLFEEHMKMLELQQLQVEQDLLKQHQSSNGHVSSNSAPTTPPVLPSNDTRARSNTMPKLTSPVTNLVTPTLTNQNTAQQQPRLPSVSRSVPTSRRNSNETPEKPAWPEIERLSIHDKDQDQHDSEKNMKRSLTGHPQSLLQAALTRNMIDESAAASTSTNQNESSSFFSLLLDDDGDASSGNSSMSSSYVRRYLQMNADDDKFPILVRRDSYPGMLSASSAALDLAPLSQTSPRHARGLESLRGSEWSSQKSLESSERHPPRSQMTNLFSDNQQIPTASNKKPLVNDQVYINECKNPDNLPTDNNFAVKAIPKLSTSYSTPDLQNHTGGLCRERSSYPPIVHKLDVATDPQPTQAYQLKSSNEYAAATAASSCVCRFYQQGVCVRGDRCQYSHNLDRNSFASMNLSLATQMGFPNVMPSLNTVATLYGQYGVNGLSSFNMFPGASSYGYGQNLASINVAVNGHNMKMLHSNNISLNKNNQKRINNELEANRFSGAMLEDLVGEIYSLCKDQHGCRYLQKKLEEKNEKYINMIFKEVFSHFVELMTDPFGNYLCQKLLEYCNDDQRTIIVETVAPELVNISLNMHGTRAVQKMIEFLSTSQQVRRNGLAAIQMVIVALNPNVVTLIKDLNGNHVIQKCLNRLSSENNQFIYNAVSQHCVEVATHRHGCCVLQRCIDHASESQKIQLVTEITYHALTLVQDPFGNYVVQYVLDLGDIRFTDALIRRFVGHVCLLSVQKFSSNVMEKCIRVAEPETRKYLIEEMLNKSRLDKLLRDSYANYVVQTSLDYADPIQRAQLVECIRPLLPAIRNTPYGKRIQGKLQREQQLQAMNSINNLNMNNLNMLAPYPFHHANGLAGGNFGNNVGIIGLNDFVPPGYPYM